MTTRADAAAVSADDYRRVMRQWPSGVTVVTTITPDGPRGLTASAFTSVSVAPPMVLVVIDKRGRSNARIARAGVFCVNILGAGQDDLSDRFAGRIKGLEDRFAGVQTRSAETGSPVVEGALAFLDCRVLQAHDAGDHTIFVGLVVACDELAEGSPLLYHDRRYADVAARSRD